MLSQHWYNIGPAFPDTPSLDVTRNSLYQPTWIRGVLKHYLQAAASRWKLLLIPYDEPMLI